MANNRFTNICKAKGWGTTEYDEFGMPFQWIGRTATLTVNLNSGSEILYFYAGSPDFSEARTISVSAPGIDQTRQIAPGWNAYQFDLSTGMGNDSREVEITVRIDKLLDIPQDTRDLGIMVRDIRCHRHYYSDDASDYLAARDNIQRRVHHYASPDAPGVLWLASFPRSGNTWLRFLLTNLLFEPVGESTQIASYIDEVIDPLYDLRQSSNREFTAFASKPAHIVKTHFPYGPSMPLLESTIGAIYVLRNPLDIAVSLRKQRPDKSDRSEIFLTYGVDPNTEHWGYGSWHGHVLSWLITAKSNSIPIIAVKYENLKSETFKTCKDILSWLKIDRSDEQIHQAIERSSLSQLKKMEAREIGSKTPGIFFALEDKSEIKAGRRFLAEGKSNNFSNCLTESEIRKGMATFGPAMKELNYI